MPSGPKKPTAERPIPAKPMLPGFYRVIPMGSDALQLRAVGRVLRVTGPGVGEFGPRLLGALSGRHTFARVVERLALESGPAADLVRHLHAEGIVSDALDNASWQPTGGNAAAHEVYGELGCSPASVQAAVSTARVAMVGLGPVGRLVARHLAVADVGELVLLDHTPVTPADQAALAVATSDLGRPRAEVTSDECTAVVLASEAHQGVVRISRGPIGQVAAEVDLVIVEVDEVGERAALANRECIAAGVASLFHSVTTLGAVVGPLVMPGTPGCHQCLVERRLSHIRHYDEHLAYQQWLSEGGTPREAALLSGSASLAAGLVSVEALRLAGGFQDPVTRTGVLVADFRASSVHRQALLPMPACPAACDARQEEAVVGSTARPRSGSAPGLPPGGPRPVEAQEGVVDHQLLGPVG